MSIYEMCINAINTIKEYNTVEAKYLLNQMKIEVSSPALSPGWSDEQRATLLALINN
jgi:hypothetical protein